jgi:hypothetical protein
MTDRIIHCGDQLEFELEHLTTSPEERSDWPLPSFDAQDWAKAFCKINPEIDEGIMLGWFANALMRGYDEGWARCFRAYGIDAIKEQWKREMVEKWK